MWRCISFWTCAQFLFQQFSYESPGYESSIIQVKQAFRSWCSQPIWKLSVTSQIGSSPQVVVKSKYFKPPPSNDIPLYWLAGSFYWLITIPNWIFIAEKYSNSPSKDVSSNSKGSLGVLNSSRILVQLQRNPPKKNTGKTNQSTNSCGWARLNHLFLGNISKQIPNKTPNLISNKNKKQLGDHSKLIPWYMNMGYFLRILLAFTSWMFEKRWRSSFFHQKSDYLKPSKPGRKANLMN